MFSKKYFNIKSYDDFYMAVGKTVEAVQKWESRYKQFVQLIGIEIEGLGTATLGKINNKLLKENKIDQRTYNNLNKVIEMRNYIYHDFFLDKPVPLNDSVENKLNEIYFYIFEATDVVENLIDQLTGCNCKRPTIFDN